MISLLTCIGVRHNPWLITLAVLVCCFGAQATLLLARRALDERGRFKVAWIFFAAIVFGTASWTGHFVAILAHVADARARLDTELTIGSLLVALAGACLTLSLATMRGHKAAPALGGGLLGLVIAAMHYSGMLALRIDGIVIWSAPRVAVSVALGALLSAAAFAELHGQFGGGKRHWLAPALLIAAMLSLHYTGMSAIEVVPLGGPKLSAGGSANTLAAAIATIAGMIMLAGGFAALIDNHNRREAGERIAALALVDRITGFPNRTAFQAEIRERCQSAPPGGRLVIIAIEIANMPAINDQFGTRIGDLVLQSIGNRLLSARRQGVFLARTGDQRFCAIGDIVDREDMLDRARKLYAVLSQDLLIEGIEVLVAIRLAGLVFPDDADTAEDLLDKTQAVLTRALSDPLGSIAVPDTEADATARRRLALAAALHGALERGELALFYQRQVRISDREVIGYEALLRWHHPELGMIPPDEFIPIAEQTGCILKIGAWILQTACHEAASWPNDVRIAVNMSALQLRQPDMAGQVADALADSGLAPDRLEIELTESLLIEDRAAALKVLRQIKALGARLALDDFGTGYSSMDVLRIGLFDKIKLDKSFVADIETDPQARAILHAMLALGRELSMPILAEGVETEEQLAILRRDGCDTVQGYLTGRPMPAESLPDGSTALPA